MKFAKILIYSNEPPVIIILVLGFNCFIAITSDPISLTEYSFWSYIIFESL